MSEKDSEAIPPRVLELLQKNEIGYISVVSPKGDLYSYPVGFYFSGTNAYFLTPTGSAKFRFIKANPKISLVVDNRKLTTEACGAMIQGDAAIFSIRQTVTSLATVAPTALKLSKKYPGLFAFYTKGKELPDERKFYKYRFVRITPTKILYWQGYKFGRYVPKKQKGGLKGLFSNLKAHRKEQESTLESIAEMLDSYEEEKEEPLSPDDPWIGRLREATSRGKVSEEERRIIQSFVQSASKGPPIKATNVTRIPRAAHGISDEERSILKKWKRSNPGNKK